MVKYQSVVDRLRMLRISTLDRAERTRLVSQRFRRLKWEYALLILGFVAGLPLVFYASRYSPILPIVVYFVLLLIWILLAFMQEWTLRKSMRGLWLDIRLLDPSLWLTAGMLGGALSVAGFYLVSPFSDLTPEAPTYMASFITFCLVFSPILYVLTGRAGWRRAGRLVRSVARDRADIIAAIGAALQSSGVRFTQHDARTMIISNFAPTFTFEYGGTVLEVVARGSRLVTLFKKQNLNQSHALPSKADISIDEALDRLEQLGPASENMLRR